MGPFRSLGGGPGCVARANWGKSGALRNFWSGQGTVPDTNSVADTAAMPNGYEPPGCWAMAPKGGGLSTYTTLYTDTSVAAGLSMGINIEANVTSAHTMTASLQALAQLVVNLVSTGEATATMQAFANLSANVASGGGLDGVALVGVANVSTNMLSDVTLTAPLSLVVSMATNMVSDGSITTAGLSLLVQLAASMVESCNVTAALGAISNMTTNMVSGADVTGPIGAIANMATDMVSGGVISGARRGTQSMAATLTSTGDVVTAESCAAAVWNALVVQFDNVGSFGEAIATGAAGITQQQIRDAMTLAASGAGVSGSIDSKIDAIPTTPAPSAASVATAVHERTVEGSLTLEQAVRILLAALSGNATGLEGATQAFKSLDGSKDRITGTYSAGTRTVTGRDGT